MINNNRFKDAPWIRKDIRESVIIGGAGGIGSWLALLLSRIGCRIYIYDFDIIEEHNIGGQFFKDTQIQKSKVSALTENVRHFSKIYLNTYREPYTENCMTTEIMFSAFDNMKARKDMFNNWKNALELANNPENFIFIDGRLEFEQLQIFCVTKDNVEKYSKYLFDDSEVEEAPCTMRQTSHTAAMIASFMTTFFTNHLTNIYEGDKVRHIPFFTEIFLPLMLITEKDE